MVTIVKNVKHQYCRYYALEAHVSHCFNKGAYISVRKVFY